MSFGRIRTKDVRSACALLCAVVLVVAMPATAQTRTAPVQVEQDDLLPMEQPRPRPTPVETAPVGRVGASSVGEVGQRQTREQAASNVQPMARIASRINNRVQNRIRNRIDRTYDPQANAASPFEVAEEQTRVTPRRRR